MKIDRLSFGEWKKVKFQQNTSEFFDYYKN